MEDAINADDFGNGEGSGNGSGGDGDSAGDGEGDGGGDEYPGEIVGEGNPQHKPAPEGTYDFLKDSDNGPSWIDTKLNPFMSKYGMATSGLSILAGMGHMDGQVFVPKFGFLAKGPLPKLLGGGGIVVSGLGIFSAMSDMLMHGFSVSSAFSLATFVIGVFSGLSILGGHGLLEAGAFSGPMGWIIVGGALAAAFAWNHFKQKQDVKTSPVGGLTGLTNLVAPPPPGWAQSLAKVTDGNGIYTILAAATSLMIGVGYNPIDLTTTSNDIRQEIIAPQLIPTIVPGLKNNLQIATNATITEKLDQGPIFIKRGEDSEHADKVIYVTQFTDDGKEGCGDPEHPCNAVNVVSLNDANYLVSDNTPDAPDMRVKFFKANSNGKITPNPDAFNALGQMTALAKAGTAAQPKSAANAVNMAALMGKKTVRTNTTPDNK